MSDSVGRSFVLVRKLLIFIIAPVTLLAPSMAFGEPFLKLHNEWRNFPATFTAGQTENSPVKVGLNENGDLIIQRREVSLVVAYNPPNDVIDYKERIRFAQRQDCPAINGISLKVSMLF